MPATTPLPGLLLSQRLIMAQLLVQLKTLLLVSTARQLLITSLRLLVDPLLLQTSNYPRHYTVIQTHVIQHIQ